MSLIQMETVRNIEIINFKLNFNLRLYKKGIIDFSEFLIVSLVYEFNKFQNIFLD